MKFSGLGSAGATSSYLSSLLAKQQETDATGVQAGTKGDKLMKAASDAALAQAAKGAQAVSGQRQLKAKADTLASELQQAMKAAGVTLAKPVEFSVSGDGKLAIKGPAQDTERVSAFLEKDTRTPSFTSRLAALTKEADGLSQTIRQNAAISQAARYAANSSGVLSLYGSLLQRQDTSTAVFTLSAAGGSLAYPGSLQSQA